MRGMQMADMIAQIPIFNVKTFFKILGLSAALIGASNASATLVIGLNPSSPLGGYDLGGGQFASLIGIQSPESLVGQTIALSNLNAAIQSGVVSGFYFAAGNPASANFGPVTPFTPFATTVVQASSSNTNPTKVWDSLYAVHSDTVVFSNGNGGTNTLSTGGSRIVDNPFTPTALPPVNPSTPASVPDSGATIGLFGAVLAGIALLRRRFIA